MENNFFRHVSYLNDVYRKESLYWQEKLAGELEKSHLPYMRPADKESPGKMMFEETDIAIPPVHARRLIEISNQSDARLHVLLMGFAALLLMKYSGNPDVLLGTSGYRQQNQGELINTVLPIRLTLTNEHSVQDLIRLTRQTIEEAMDHRDYPVELMFKNVGLNNRMLDVAVVLDNVQDSGDLTNELCNLVMVFHREGAGLSARFRYHPNVYSRDTVVRCGEHFNGLLEAALGNLQYRLQEISILTKAERNIITRLNDTKVSFPEEATLVSLFEQCVHSYPGRTALVHEHQRLSYQELHDKSNRLARILQSRGVEKGTIIALFVPPSPELIIGMLGILKAGGVYLPLDPEQPDQRTDYMLSDSGATCMVTLRSFDSMRTGCELVYLDETEVFEGSESDLPRTCNPEDAAYIIYTSGTTGQPKGVVIEHRNVVRLFFHDMNRFDFTCQDVWTLFHSCGFDVAVWEIFGALLHGGKLCILPSILKKDYRQVIKLMLQEQVTVFSQTPSSFYQFIHEELRGGKDLSGLRYVILGGEALSPGKIKEWYERYPHSKIINMYGITETTVHSTFKEITYEEIRRNISSIGVPLPTVQIHILNQQLETVPVGAVGEMWIGGEGVAREYLNRPMLNKERFVTHLIEGREARLYRSGDLGRLLPNGEIEYLGRADRQIKIRGYRIEPDEVAVQLQTHEDVEQAVVMVRRHSEDSDVLCAYVVINAAVRDSFDPQALRHYAQERLSSYMVPSFIIPIDVIPLTFNGKTDYEQLAAIEPQIMQPSGFVGPETPLEQQIASVWQTVLPGSEVGVQSTVFELGGSSFDVMKISERLTDALKQEVSVVTLFTYPTIRLLAQILEEQGKNPALEADDRSGPMEDGKRARMQKLRILKK